MSWWWFRSGDYVTGPVWLLAALAGVLYAAACWGIAGLRFRWRVGLSLLAPLALIPAAWVVAIAVAVVVVVVGVGSIVVVQLGPPLVAAVRAIPYNWALNDSVWHDAPKADDRALSPAEPAANADRGLSSAAP